MRRKNNPDDDIVHENVDESKTEEKKKVVEKKDIKELLFNEDGSPNVENYMALKGRKPFMRDDPQDDYKVIHKAVDNDGIYR